MILKAAIDAVVLGLIAAPALADRQAAFRFEDGKAFSIVFSNENNFRDAEMTFEGSQRVIGLVNRGMGSGVGGGWSYNEWHGSVTLTDDRAQPPKETACHKVAAAAQLASPLPEAATVNSSTLPRFDSMRYFILDSAKQGQGTRGSAYVNLIGDFAASSFTVYYRGMATGLVPTRRSRHLVLLLKNAGHVVGTVDLADLSKVRGSITVNRRAVPVSCKAPMRDIDEVDARIQP